MKYDDDKSKISCPSFSAQNSWTVTDTTTQNLKPDATFKVTCEGRKYLFSEIIFVSCTTNLVDFNIILTILFKKSFSGNVPLPGSGTYNNYLSDQPVLSSGDKKEYAITRNKGNLGKLYKKIIIVIIE